MEKIARPIGGQVQGMNKQRAIGQDISGAKVKSSAQQGLAI
jgi:hypothetical protein